MAERISSKSELVEELKARYGFVGINNSDPNSLINKNSISKRVEEIFKECDNEHLKLGVETKSYPILSFRDILATVTTALFDNEVIASQVAFHPSKPRGFVPRNRYSLYRTGWLSTPAQDPVKIQVTEFVRGSQVVDFYLYTRRVDVADVCAVGGFLLDLEGQQRIVSKLGLTY